MRQPKVVPTTKAVVRVSKISAKNYLLTLPTELVMKNDLLNELDDSVNGIGVKVEFSLIDGKLNLFNMRSLFRDKFKPTDKIDKQLVTRAIQDERLKLVARYPFFVPTQVRWCLTEYWSLKRAEQRLRKPEILNKFKGLRSKHLSIEDRLQFYIDGKWSAVDKTFILSSESYLARWLEFQRDLVK